MSDSVASSAAHGALRIDGPAVDRLRDPARLALLRRSTFLDGDAVVILDRLATIASAMLNVPIALVSFVDDEWQHFPGLVGLGGWAGEQRGTPLSHSFCKHVVERGAPLVITNAADVPSLALNGAHTELGVVAYAGVPMRSRDGHTLGALCAIDTVPHAWTPEDVAMLEELAVAAVREFERQVDGRGSEGRVAGRDAMDEVERRA